MVQILNTRIQTLQNVTKYYSHYQQHHVFSSPVFSEFGVTKESIVRRYFGEMALIFTR